MSKIKKKELGILKPNEIIRGNPLNLSLEAKKMMNAVIWGTTKYHSKKNEVLKIPFKNLRKLMNLSSNNNYISIIESALKSLATPILLKNYTDTNGKFYKAKALACIDNSYNYGKEQHFKKSEEWVVEFKLNDEFFTIITKAFKGNFTTLKWRETSNKLSSKYSIAIYEYLMSFYKNNFYLEVRLSTINEIFGLTDKPLPLSKVLIILKRCIKEILVKTDLNYLEFESNKQHKMITFFFIPKENITKSHQKNITQRKIQELIN
jgi:hypothetical protein